MRELESVVRHEVRLSILGALAYSGSLTLQELQKRVGVSLTQMRYHIRLLQSHDLVGDPEETTGGEERYAITLDRQEDWVGEAITAHQLARRISLSTHVPALALAGTKCDKCERLLRYEANIVAIFDEGGTRSARILTEDKPERPQMKRLQVIGKYHDVCYEQARTVDPSLPIAERCDSQAGA